MRSSLASVDGFPAPVGRPGGAGGSSVQSSGVHAVAALSLAVILGISTATAAVAASPGAPAIFADAEAMYAQAALLVARTPTSRSALAKIPADDPAHALFAKMVANFGDRDLAAAGPALPQYVAADLLGYASFVGAAVEKTTSCDRVGARLLLRVAREFLDDAKAGGQGAKAADASDEPGDHPFPADRTRATQLVSTGGICPPP